MDDESPKHIGYISKPLDEQQLAELKALAERSDVEIDFSDAAEAGEEFLGVAERGTMYRVLKQQLTIRLDADVLDWFKRHAKNGRGYQTDINSALRSYVIAQEKRLSKKTG